MTKWVCCASCLLLIMAATVLDTPAQTPKAPVKPVNYTESFGDSEYRIGPEDVVEIFVLNEEEVSVTAPVRPDGKITVKLVGEIVATGKTAKELESEVQAKLRDYIKTAQVTAVVKEVNSPKVSVFGEVRKPDVYKIKQKTTVLGAVALAGGFTEFAKKDKVIVIRDAQGRQQQFKLNVNSMLRGQEANVFYIEPGDTIYVQ